MNCQECIEILFEEESGGEATRAAVAHLTECVDCRTLAREIGANAAALRAMRDDVMPVRPSVRSGTWSRYFYPGVAAAGLAAAALLAAVGLSVWRSSAHPQSAATGTQQASRPEVGAVLPVPSSQEANRVLAVNHSERPPTPTSRLARKSGDRKGAESRNLAKATQARDARPAPMKILTADPNVVIYLVLGNSSVEASSEGEDL